MLSNYRSDLAPVTLMLSLLSSTDYTTLGETAAVAEWVRAWNTLTMFEGMVCGRS